MPTSSNASGAMAADGVCSGWRVDEVTLSTLACRLAENSASITASDLIAGFLSNP